MNACAESPAMPRYLLDGEQVSLRELLAVNDFGGDEVVQLRNLPPGQSVSLHGATLTRLPVETAT